MGQNQPLVLFQAGLNCGEASEKRGAAIMMLAALNADWQFLRVCQRIRNDQMGARSRLPEADHIPA